MRLCIAWILLIGCNSGQTSRTELDSILRSEDSIRMNTDISSPLINIKEIIITNDPNVDFARLMRQYYIVALSGAEIELKKGRRKIVLDIAKDQLSHHNADIEWLDEYLHNHPPQILRPQFYTAFVSKLQEGNISSGNFSTDFDIQFLELVIKHHNEAVLLTEVFERYGTDSLLLTKFREIAKAHLPEIGKLTTLANTLGKKN